MAGVSISEEKMHILGVLGVKDSKLLSKNKREELFDEIVKVADSYHIIEISAKEIDQMNAVGTNLNKLEAMKAAEIVNELNPSKVILDSPEPTAEKFAVMVGELVKNSEIKLISEHKADINHKVVAAASILAKVTRDRRIEEIKKEFGYDFGSGYPSDPLCQKFLKEYFRGADVVSGGGSSDGTALQLGEERQRRGRLKGAQALQFEGNISDYIRKCWAPYQLAKEEKEQKKLFDF